ncbi:MAG: hypothetical protein EAZ27_11280 [Cytophagales bacterium]|nr:MAG: hypothetical protein EAZ27_11280 [Cytophagales bacterium]
MLKKYHLSFILLSISSTLLAQLIPNLGGQRTGISTLTFLKEDVSPRSIAMAGATTTLKGDAYAAHWNPAGLTEISNHSFAASTRMYPASIIHSFFAANLKLSETDVFAFTINNFNLSNQEIRTEFQPGGIGQKFIANNFALAATYAKALTYKFSMGLTIRYINERMDVYSAHAVAADLGFIYKTDFKDLRFGVFLQNFGPNSRASGSYVSTNFANKGFAPDAFSLPNVFKLGASIVPFKKNNHSITTAIELHQPSDNAANIRIGLEYSFMEMFFARTGYWLNFNTYVVPTFGAGVKSNLKFGTLYFTYAFATARTFIGTNHSLGIEFILNKPNQSNDIKE